MRIEGMYGWEIGLRFWKVGYVLTYGCVADGSWYQGFWNEALGFGGLKLSCGAMYVCTCCRFLIWHACMDSEWVMVIIIMGKKRGESGTSLIGFSHISDYS